ncbi:MAG: YybH family protein, partial [Flavobacteriales bacterium]
LTMKRISVLLFISLLFSVFHASAACSCTRKVQAVLEMQQEAWNRGDIEGFMAGYSTGPELRFVSGKKVTSGWQQTLDNYKKAYPGKEAMGTLEFSELQITCAGAGRAIVSGAWNLSYPETPSAGGRFTLIFRKTKSNWKIVYDHTS